LLKIDVYTLGTKENRLKLGIKGETKKYGSSGCIEMN
jgi:hypothetical protein